MVNFTPNIPSTGQTLGGTRDDIRNNFTNYYDNMTKNHVDVNQADRGKHKFMQMPEQGSDPATLANEIGLFCKQGSGSVAQLFFRNENNGIVQQLTGAFDAGNNGKIEFFGFKLKWGFQAAVPPSSNTTITYIDSLGNPDPFTSAVYIVIPSCGTFGSNSAESASVVGTPNINNFVVRTSAGATNRTVYYIAIGI